MSSEASRLANDAGITYLENLCIGVVVKSLGTHPRNDA